MGQAKMKRSEELEKIGWPNPKNNNYVAIPRQNFRLYLTQLYHGPELFDSGSYFP
jgi:hypothetical protein